MRNITLSLLFCVLCLCLASSVHAETEMNNFTNLDEDYFIQYPRSWTREWNTDYEIPIFMGPVKDNFPMNAYGEKYILYERITLLEILDTLLEEADTLEGLTVINDTETSIDGYPALIRVYTAENERGIEVQQKYVGIMTEGYVYVFYFTSSSASYEKANEEFFMPMMESIRICTMNQTDDRFRVEREQYINETHGFSVIYPALWDRTVLENGIVKMVGPSKFGFNINFNIGLQDQGNMTLSSYAILTDISYNSTYTDYVVHGEYNDTFDGYEGFVRDYSINYTGTLVTQRQVYIIKDGNIYVQTYTSHPDTFEEDERNIWYSMMQQFSFNTSVVDLTPDLPPELDPIPVDTAGFLPGPAILAIIGCLSVAGLSRRRGQRQ